MVLTEGLTISLLGILVTFLALGIFILLMVVLQKVFPYREKNAVDQVSPAEPQVESTPDDEEQMVAAAIAAAVSAVRAVPHGDLGSALREERSPWWSANLLHARQGSTHRKK